MLRTLRIMLILSIVVAAGATAGTSWAADLQAVIDMSRQNLTLTNTLRYDLYVMHLEGGESSFPIMVRVAAGKTLKLSIKGKPVPSVVTSATCIFTRPDRLPKEIPFEKGSDGFYRLSVESL